MKAFPKLHELQKILDESALIALASMGTELEWRILMDCGHPFRFVLADCDICCSCQSVLVTSPDSEGADRARVLV